MNLLEVTIGFLAIPLAIALALVVIAAVCASALWKCFCFAGAVCRRAGNEIESRGWFSKPKE